MGGEANSWSLEELLSAYPWDDDVLGGVEPIEYLFAIELPADSDELWEHLADTSRLNRMVGISQMFFEEREGKLYGRSRAGGLEHRWLEVPWNWITGRTMSAERAYSAGFAKHARVRYDLMPRDDGVVLYAYFGFVPRNWLYGWLIRLGMRPLERQLTEALEALHASTLADTTRAAPTEQLPQGVVGRLDALAQQLEARSVSGEALDRLIELIRIGDDVDVHRLQVRKLAHEWKIPERKLLHLFLHATRVGLLELSWDVVCPHCRGARQELASLGAVPNKASCEPCALEFGTDGPNAIEITFRIHPSIRDVPKQMFCSAQTAERRHVKVQQVLEPGETRMVETRLGFGRYRMRTLSDSARYAYLDVGYVDDSLDERAFADGAIAWRASELPPGTRCDGEPSFELVNDRDEPVTYIVEDVNWADDALRPAHLFCYQGFRDLFSEEYIGADVHLAIGEQVILFTDIVGSTKLYLDRGDPQAFAAVRRHFTEVFDVVDAHEGAIVKTIGDATMAAFSDSIKAVAAARAIHERFPPKPDAAIRLRISMNMGVCIAVNLNSSIDYFGNAVNLAAKLQLLAGAGDVVISEEVWTAPGVQEYAAAEDLTFDAVDFDFDALGEVVTAYRLATVEHARGRRKAG